MMEYRIYSKGKFLCRAKIVNGWRAMLGLMFRIRLKKKDALMLELPKHRVDIHSWFMFFPIDLFFLDEKFRVIEKASLSPWKIYLPKRRAKYLLEANKGELKIGLGERLSVV
ncbi:MAG: DUF192 domain-containing protein [Candidatus Aenigmatarchaeota archaeon]